VSSILIDELHASSLGAEDVFVLSINLCLCLTIVFLFSSFNVLFDLDILSGFEKGVVVNGAHVLAHLFHVFGFLNE